MLIGTKTYEHKSVQYEIQKSWNDGKGVVGIYIHDLKNREEQQAKKGYSPFFERRLEGTTLANIVKAYDLPFSESKESYNDFRLNMFSWIDDAILIRKRVLRKI